MALKSISEAQHAQKKFDQAAKNLRKFFEISPSNWVRDSSNAFYRMTFLENCSTKQDRLEEAAKLKAGFSEAALSIDTLFESLTHSSKWLRDDSTASWTAIEENIDRLKTGMKFAVPQSKPGGKDLCPSCKRVPSTGRWLFSCAI
jgi:hypothetical protein